MRTTPLLAAALVAATSVLAGCTGLTGIPEGAADIGDTVTVRYTATLANGTVVRTDRTASFVLGTGASGLGLGFERGVRGRAQGESFQFTVDDDASLGFGQTRTTPRDIPSLDARQDITRREFETSLGVPTVGRTFDAYGFYTAHVTNVTATSVSFEIRLNGTQQDPVPIVGAILESHVHGDEIVRRLAPDEGKTFTINPPTPQSPQTPLGLAPGTYRTVGATDDAIVYSYSSAGGSDLIGQKVRYTGTVVRIVEGVSEIEPVDGNYAARRSPYLNGDAESFLGSGNDAALGHAH